MIEELRIKCPSCGVILEVKNSKHEDVKRIVCPNCKRQLTVDFQEKPEPKPIVPIYYSQMLIALQEGINQVPIPDCEHLEINVVRLADGGSKCIVRPLSAAHPVLLNGEKMEQEDKVVLAVGDLVQIGNTQLSYGKPTMQLLNDGTKPKPEPVPIPEPANPHSYGWLIGLVTTAAAMFLALFVFSKCFKGDNLPLEEKVVEKPIVIDTPLVKLDPEIEKTEPSTKKEETAKECTQPSYSSMSDYDLEVLARNDASAQYEFGRRKVAKGDSANMVIGINYLKLAKSNGSYEADIALQKAYTILEQKAAEGYSFAESILSNQR